jgi:glycosyltransferase involved in cell wall biosynthesis
LHIEVSRFSNEDLVVNILIVADAYPAPDRNSADFRLSTLLSMLAQEHAVFYCAIAERRQVEAIGKADVERYRDALPARGIIVVEGGVKKALRARQYAAVMFEWFFAARTVIDEVRVAQPDARIIIDSVDVVFNRLRAKAALTKSREDSAKADAVKTAELATYDRADLVITVTDADATILQRENSNLATFTIPNIHPLEDPVFIPEQHDKQLLFVGSFMRPGGETNIDAMSYFCREILPLIAHAHPDVRLSIIGSSPPAEIAAFASDRVTVLGFVPDIKPHLQTATISVAPLRFGGGMKGKIGEAMSFGLPVVTTSIGIEGFGLEPNVDALVADSPKDFADATSRLLANRVYLEQVRLSGYEFIRSHYSDLAVRRRIDTLLSTLETYPVKKMASSSAWLRKAKERWDEHVGWRFK